MKKLTLIFIMILPFALTVCTTVEPEPEPSATPLATTPPLNTAPANPEPTSPPATELPPEPSPVPATETAVPEAAYPGEPPAAEAAADSQTAYPVEVDLSQITSEPADDDSPQEAPAPGVPDAETAIVHQVSQDLAKRLGLDISEITTITVAEVEWSDAAIGCPKPGTGAAAVITPGYRILLEGNEQTFTYHTDRNGNFVLCGDDGHPVSEEE